MKGPKKGATVTIVDEQGGPNEEHLPKAKSPEKTKTVDKAVVDAPGAVGSRRYDGSNSLPGRGPAPTKSEMLPEAAGSAADAAQASQNVFRERPIYGDTVFFERGGTIPSDPKIIRSEPISDTSAVIIKIP